MASDRVKFEKPKSNSSIKHIPKDAQVIMSILKTLNISEYDPRVINQLLEFTHTYITSVLDEAKAYAHHGKKKIIGPDEVKMATIMVLGRAYTSPPKREVLLDLACDKIIEPLPLRKSHCGLRLPPERHCLLSENYKLRAAELLPKKLTKSALVRPAPINKLTGVTTLRRQSIAKTPKTQTINIPKPFFKFSGSLIANSPTGGGSGNNENTTTLTSNIQIQQSQASANCNQSKTNTDVLIIIDDEIDSSDSRGLKRKREEVDDYDFEMFG